MSRSDFIAVLDHLATAAIAVGARPANAAACRDVSAWRIGAVMTDGTIKKAGPRFASVTLSGDQAIALSGPGGSANGVELWGVVNGVLGLLAYLNKGLPITIAGVGQGYHEELQDVGACTALYVAADKDVGSPMAVFVPLETMGDVQ